PGAPPKLRWSVAVWPPAAKLTESCSVDHEVDQTGQCLQPVGAPAAAPERGTGRRAARWPGVDPHLATQCTFRLFFPFLRSIFDTG
ncbi:hypothetical protein LH612_30990, partial [Klebsiella pneumoniae]|nr:hypothetical protein [Klebsiella pneumoniae]